MSILRNLPISTDSFTQLLTPGEAFKGPPIRITELLSRRRTNAGPSSATRNEFPMVVHTIYTSCSGSHLSLASANSSCYSIDLLHLASSGPLS